MDSIIGKDILGYKVIEKIGTGGFGDVYKVERNNIVGNVTRALKLITLPKESQYMEILNSMGGDSEKADNYFKQELNRVVNEIRVFSMISEKDNHNIVSYYENDVQKDGKYKYNIYILMEMLTPLDKWLSMNNLTVEQAIEIGLGVANALKICHENHIMHRDIKVNNIFVSKDGKFKLGDFGVSKKLDMMTRANTIKGTPHYIAPEVYMGKSDYDNSVDIYSLGILLYCLFNKRRFPFYPNFPEGYTQEDEDKAFYKRMSYEVLEAPICAPEGISKVILKAISRPEERYNSASEFISDLEAEKLMLSTEELNEKIGFEPMNKSEQVVMDKKENDLVANLEGNDSKSISFGQHTIETLSHRKMFWKEFDRKKITVIATTIAVVLLLIVAIGFGSGILKKDESVKTDGVIEETSTEQAVETKESVEITEETTVSVVAESVAEIETTENSTKNAIGNDNTSNSTDKSESTEKLTKAEVQTTSTQEKATKKEKTTKKKENQTTMKSDNKSKDNEFEFDEITETEGNEFGFDNIVE